MNLIGAIYAVRRYGLKGVVDYILRHLKPNNVSRFLRRKNTASAPVPGITIIGSLDQPTSLSKVLRDLARMLKKSGIPYQALNIPKGSPIPDPEYADIVTPRESFVTNKYSHVITMRQSFDIPDKRCSLHAIEFWEFEDGFRECQPEASWIKKIIAMSNFNLTTFRKQIPNATVEKILYPFQFEHQPLPSCMQTRKKYGISDSSFMLFFNFDFRSSFHRKNPEGILRAFSKAFTPADDTVIVFKTMRAKLCHPMNARLHDLAKQLNITEKLITIDDFIPQEDLVNLTNASDVYISLHRGEGFGLGIAEAMSLGKPVIVTNYSSTTEFCNNENALLIPFSMVPVKKDQHDIEEYKHVSQWAEPDIDAAAQALRQLYDSPELRKRLGENGKHFIEDYFSLENFKKSIEAFLAE